VNAGDTFIPPKPYDHLYMVISDPSVDSERIVLVNFTSFDVDEEDCCIAQKGEHPFLTRKSCVRYKDARITSTSAVDKLVAGGKMRQHKPLSDGLLKRVRDGASNSDFLPEGCRKILEDQELI
jgi:hypothetical protein